MRKLICALSLILISMSAAAAQFERREFRTLVLNNSHVVSYEKQGSKLVISMEMIADYTNNRRATHYTKQDFTSFRIDLNNNNQVDRDVDIAFGQRALTDILCSQYLRDRQASSVCGALPTRAGVKISFEKTAFHNTEHPVFEFSIPISELTAHSRTVGFEFLFHSAGSGFTFYPASASLVNSFKETLVLNLDEL